MNAKDAIKSALTSTQYMLGMYLADLSDADLLVRPVPGANHIAWQLGHLTSSEVRMAKEIPSSSIPELPAGFDVQHAQANAGQEGPKGFATKQEYLSLFNKVRDATLANLAKVSESDLDKPITGKMVKLAPTVGALFLLAANHTMMHAGQFSVVRRKLGKPILF